MAKFQTKINFLEKKKTSDRLQEVFNNKEVNCKSVLKNANDTTRKSPRKKQIASIQLQSPSKKSLESCSVQDKENITKNKGIFRNSDAAASVGENMEKIRHSPRKRLSTPMKINLNDGGSSPPKKECTEKATSGTPSQLITKLFLDSPEKPQSCKELFPKGKFDEACKALHSSAPTSLPGREDKLDYIKGFLHRHCEEESSGSLYISGPPGTGKTACVNIALKDPQIQKGYTVVCSNCTTLNSRGSVYNRIVRELRLKTSVRTEKGYLAVIEKHLHSKNRKMILVVLDELDQLCSSKQSVLYSIFEWPALNDSRIVLIGIANALDLTDRLLPRLQARLALQPSVLHFPSYTRQQIIDIISDRLHQAGVEEVFSGAALPLLAGKVAAVNGDVRRALDIARRVVEIADRRTVLQSLSDNGPSKQTVALQEVMSVVNDVYSTAQSLDTSQAGSFPLQQKLLICSLLLIRQESKTKDTTVGKLHEVYKKVCERRNMSALDISEFISLMSLVEARGVLRVSGKTPNRLSKIILQWDEYEIKSALQDKQLLAAVLMDKGVAS